MYAFMAFTDFYEWRARVSVFSYLLAGFLFSSSILVISLHVFPFRSLADLQPTSKFRDLQDQELLSNYSRWGNHFKLCNHTLIIFKCSPFVCSRVEILSSGLALQIHLAITASFFSCQITSSSLTGQVLLLVTKSYQVLF